LGPLFLRKGFEIAVFVRSEINSLGIVGEPSSELAGTVVRGEIDLLLAAQVNEVHIIAPAAFHA
jgi:hypothetical protein